MAHENRWNDDDRWRNERTTADERRRYERDYADLVQDRNRYRGGDYPSATYGAPFGMGYGYWESDWVSGDTRSRDRDWNREDQRRGRSNRNEERGFFERAGDEVASWFGDEDAARRRNQDARYRGHGPRGYTRTDERIAEDINDRLTDDPYVDASDITVTVREAEVTLDGTVENRYAKRRSEDIAENIAGVKHVQNNLRYRQVSASSAAASAISGLSNTTTSASSDASDNAMSVSNRR